MAKLTAKSVENWPHDPARRMEVPDAAMPGLYLIVQHTGAKSWALRYRHGGKPRKMTLGPYPAFSLASARDEAAKALRMLETGTDPAEERKVKAATEIEAKRAAESDVRDKVSNVAADFIKRHASRNRTGDEVAAILRREVLPLWGDRRVQEITRRDVIELLDAVVDRGHPIAANRLRAHLSVFFKWCRGRDIIKESPVEGTPKPANENPRDRVLTDAEIRRFWQACEKIGPPFGLLYRFLLLTGQRLREAAEMTDSEVSGNEWTIPARRAKNGQEHLVPLSEIAKSTLEKMPRVVGRKGFIFSTTGASAVSGYSRGKERLDKAMQELASQELPEDSAPTTMAPFTIHDLRRTAATGMASLRIAPHVVESVLNHRSGTRRGVAGIYNRADYAAEKREALEAWARALDTITAGTPAKVVQLRAPR
ncbi:MAG: integrase arm-type DNA-binding domain-containing protein [Rhodobacteraceae bacterium]|nr:integrase arm-type DNA-binding domain-containing protein [Paracoccaceae bacterium]